MHWQQRWLEAMNRAPAPALHLPNVPRDPEGARLLLAQADDLRARGYITPLAFALAANVAHDTESLFRWLDVAYEERSVQLPYLLRDPALPQSDPRARGPDSPLETPDSTNDRDHTTRLPPATPAWRSSISTAASPSSAPAGCR